MNNSIDKYKEAALFIIGCSIFIGMSFDSELAYTTARGIFDGAGLIVAGMCLTYKRK